MATLRSVSAVDLTRSPHSGRPLFSLRRIEAQLMAAYALGLTNDEIYELGFTESQVSIARANALRKLGVNGPGEALVLSILWGVVDVVAVAETLPVSPHLLHRLECCEAELHATPLLPAELSALQRVVRVERLVMGGSIDGRKELNSTKLGERFGIELPVATLIAATALAGQISYEDIAA